MPEHVLTVSINPKPGTGSLLVSCICGNYSQEAPRGEITAPQLDQALQDHVKQVHGHPDVQMLSRALQFLRSGDELISEIEQKARMAMGNSVAIAQMDFYRDPNQPLGQRLPTVMTGYALAQIIVDRLAEGRDGAILDGRYGPR